MRYLKMLNNGSNQIIFLFGGVNNNPAQERWSSSPKIYAHLYIDDAALGVPLKLNKKISDRYFVDWEKVENFLRENGII